MRYSDLNKNRVPIGKADELDQMTIRFEGHLYYPLFKTGTLIGATGTVEAYRIQSDNRREDGKHETIWVDADLNVYQDTVS
jgi:hypothetical protein